MLHKSQIFLVLMIAFLAGVAIASFFVIANFWIYIFLIGLIVLFLINLKNKIFRVILFALIVLLLGLVRYNFSMPENSQQNISFYNGLYQEFYGYVNEEPDERLDHVKLKIKTEYVLNENSFEDISGNVLVKTSLFPKYSYGDYLKIKCRLITPEKIEDFAYDKYLARYNIYSTCYSPQIYKLGEGYGNLVYAEVLQLKKYLLEKINILVPEPQASFLAGILIGARKGISADLTEAFNRTGITHIIAISGFNITIIAVMILNASLSVGVSRKKSFWVSAFIIFFFVLICGMPSSVVRAGIMGLLVLLSQNIGRVTKMSNILLLVCFVMVLVNPKILIFDAGFQLSFLATIGLIYLNPIISKKFEKLSNIFQIKESALTTFSAILITTPLIIFQFNRLSVVALLVNILVLPIIPISMALGFIALILGVIWIPLAQVFSWSIWFVLEYVIRVTLFFGEFSLASLELPKIPWQIMVMLYLLIIYWMFLWKRD